MVGLAIIPLLGAVGAAIDYSRANATRTAFQAALEFDRADAVEECGAQTPEQLQAAAIGDFNALFVRPDAKNVSVTVNYSTVSGSKLVLNGSAVIDTNFLSVLGIDTINITASATSTWGNTRLRVALVLDNTGSMASSDKMTALKTASHNLLSQLQIAAVNPEDVYVSVVPFNKDVNVDAANYANSWLRWDLWDEVNGTCSNTSYRFAKQLRVALQSMDGSGAQHLERLRHRPRPEFRHHQRRADGRRQFVSDRAVFLLPGLADGPVQRLDRAVQQDRRHAAGRQHQPGDRLADGLAVAHRRAFHHSGHGSQLPV